MKKLYASLLILITIFSCSFLFACKDNAMQIKVLDDVNSVQLTIDDSKPSENKQILKVEVTGAKKDASKRVYIYSEPSELVSVSSTYSDGITTATITANDHGTSGEGANLIIKTVEGKKQISLPLKINKTLKSFLIKNNKAVFELPNTTSGNSTYNLSNSLVTVSPVGATDMINWQKVETAGSTNIVNLSQVTVNQNKIIIPNNLPDGSYLELRPFVEQTGSANIVANGPYQNVKVYFIKKLVASDIKVLSETHGVANPAYKIKTSDIEKDAKILPGQGLVLLSNRQDKAAGEYYNLSTISLGRISGNTITELSGDIYFTKCSYDKKIIDIKAMGNNSFTVTALSNTSGAQTYITFAISRTGPDGTLLDSVEYNLKYAVVQAPNAFNLKLDSQPVEINTNQASVNLYDVYAIQSGAPFVFSLTPTDNYAQFLQYYRLTIDAKFLPYNANSIFDIDKKLLTESEYNNLFSSRKINNYQLQITHLGSNIKFYLQGDASSGYSFISEPILSNNTLMIKYSNLKNSNADNDTMPTFSVGNYIYSMANEDYSYFNNIKINLTVNCEIKQGISEIQLAPGYLMPNGQPKTFYNTVNNQDRYFMFGLIDAPGTSDLLSEGKINLKISSNSQNLLLKQSDGSINFLNEITYTDHNTEAKRWVYFKSEFAGNYKIIIAHENGVKLEINVVIYEELTSGEIVLDPAYKSSYYHVNEIYEDDKTKYMDIDVATNSKIYFQINTNNNAKTDTPTYSYEGANASQHLLNPSTPVRVAHKPYSNNTKFELNTYAEGTMINNVRNYIQFNIKITQKKYKDNFDIDQNNPIVREFKIRIFIYVPVTSIRLDKSVANVKSESSLSLADQSESTLKLTATILPQKAIDYLDTFDISDGNGIVVDKNGKLIWQHAIGQYTTALKATDGNYLPGQYKFDLQSVTSGVQSIFVYISQYGITFDARCDVSITHAVKVSDFELDTYLPILSDGLPYIYFDNKAGLEASLQLDFTIKPANSFNKNLTYIITDVNNNRITDAPVSVRSGLVTSLKAGRAIIWVFPQDCIIGKIPDNTLTEGTNGAGLTFLKDVESVGKKLYLKINVTVADGSYANPYFISGVKDLKEISTNAESMTKHYALINDIIFSDTDNANFVPIGFSKTQITPFTGSLRSYYECDCEQEECECSFTRFSILNFKLTQKLTKEHEETNPYIAGLFAKLQSTDGILHTGVIENIDLSVSYDMTIGNIDTGYTNRYYGSLVAINNGVIKNCTVNIIGTSSVKITGGAVGTIDFGGITALNEGIIEYTNGSLVGVKGSIIINTDLKQANNGATINAGGVAGINKGTINGALSYAKEQDPENYEPKISTVYLNEGAISALNITLTATENIMPQNGISTGGVAGLNDNGKIYECYTTGTLIGFDNVGGLIGKNIGIGLNIVFTTTTTKIDEAVVEDINSIDAYSAFQHYDNYTSATVSGINYVGGVVGYDDKGSYYYVNSEYYLTSDNKTTAAVSGKNYVGGFAGKSAGGVFAYCFAVSYKLTSTATDFVYDSNAVDVLIDNQSAIYDVYMGGFIGAMSGAFVLRSYSTLKIVAKIKSTHSNSNYAYVGGFAGYAQEQSYLQHVFSRGQIYIESEEINSAPTFEVAGIIAGAATVKTSHVEKVYTTMDYRISFNLSEVSNKRYFYAVNPRTGFWDLWNFNFALEREITGGFIVDDEFYNSLTAPFDLKDKDTYSSWDNFDDIFNLNATSNHGLPYLLYPYRDKDNDTQSSISTEAPVSVQITIKPFVGNVATRAIDISDKTANNSIVLFMYNIQSQTNGQAINSLKLNKDFATLNTIALSDLISVKIVPHSFRVQRLVVSLDSDIIEFADGNIVLRQTGKITLKIYSPLDSSKYDTLTIYVVDALTLDTPVNIQNAFKLYSGTNTADQTALLEQNKLLQIKVGNAVALTSVYSGVVNVLNTYYNYAANSLMGIRYQYITGDKNAIKIADQNFDDNNYIFADNNVATFISAINRSENDIVIKATPYLILDIGTAQPLRIILEEAFANITDILQLGKQFKVSTQKGVQSVSLDGSINIEMSQKEEISITFRATTDKYEYDQDTKIYEFLTQNGFDIQVKNSNNQTIAKDTTTDADYKFEHLIINIESTSYNSGTEKGVVYFNLEVDRTVYISSDIEYTVTFKMEDKTVSLKVKVKKQIIDSLRATNYILQTDNEISGDFYKEINVDKIQPGIYGLIKIDVAQPYAYYDYIKIVNADTNQPISFLQVYKSYTSTNQSSAYFESGQTITTTDGIKLSRKMAKSDQDTLYTENNQFVETYYVKTLIESAVTTGTLYTVNIVACVVENGVEQEIKYGPPLTVSVQNLPSISLAYIDPQGKTMPKSDSAYTYDLAINTSAQIFANAENIDENSLSTSSFTVQLKEENDYTDIVGAGVQLINGSFYLQMNGLSDDYLGETIRVKCTVGQTINKDVKTKDDNLEFVLKKAVIHNISFKNVYKGTMTVSYGETHKLQAYFDKNDISFYDDRTDDQTFNGTYNSQVYDYTTTNGYNAAEGSNIKFISDILGALNNNLDNQNIKYFTIKRTLSSTYESILLNTERNGIMFGSNVSEGLFYFNAKNNQSHNSTIRLLMNYYFDGAQIPKLDYVNNNSPTRTISNSFNLSVVAPTSLYSALPVNDLDQFMAMTAGRHYILTKNIKLENYVPLNIELGSFDGNGYTITIESFDLAAQLINNNTQLNLGLFATVYENMIVQNVVLKIPKATINTTNISDSQDVKLEVTSLNFGGITPENRGIITNCIVMSDIDNLDKNLQSVKYNSSAAVNQLLEADYALKFVFASGGQVPQVYISGLVTNNNGYITNCKVIASIKSYGNLSGVVHQNNGVISSTKFIGGQITYNPLGSTTLSCAGFVHTNNGKIQFSYAEGMHNTTTASNTENDQFRCMLGGITSTSSGEVGGFVYINNQSGKIENCYADVKIASNSRVSGFVFNNKGIINKCISYSSVAPNTFYSPMVATDTQNKPNNTGEMTDCYYLKGSQIWDASTGQGTVLIIENFTVDKPAGFIFDENDSGIWYSREFIKDENTYKKPTLVSANVENNPTKTKVEDDETDSLTGEKIYTYTGSSSDNNVGSQKNPYIIYSAQSWDAYIMAGKDKQTYYRFVKDIDFAQTGANPQSSAITFLGSIEGNGMQIKNLVLHSDERSLDYIGLFKEVGGHNLSIRPIIKNLSINATSINATKVKAVGILAGVITSSDIYNITVDCPSYTILGQNAVGGLAGVIRGKINIDTIVSNVSVNSGYRYLKNSQYNLYQRSLDTKGITSNLGAVSYAGAVAGIVDAYTTGSETVNDVKRTYYFVNNITVQNNITIIGETAGSAFGLITENTVANNVNYVLGSTTRLKSSFVAGGLVGENRGIISNSKVTYAAIITNAINALAEGATSKNISGINNNCFEGFAKIAGGLVGINNGGIIYNCSSNINVINSGNRTVAGGLAGRNINGIISKSSASGFVFARIAGGLVGTHTDDSAYTDSNSDITTNSRAVIRSNSILNATFITNSTDANSTYINNLSELINKLSITASDNTSNNNLKYYFKIISTYSHCNVNNINWDSTYFESIIKLNYASSSNTVSYLNALGAIIGAAETENGFGNEEIITLFANVLYNNLYKHGQTLNAASVYASGYYSLLPVAVKLNNLDNWYLNNGYNGTQTLYYFTTAITSGIEYYIKAQFKNTVNMIDFAYNFTFETTELETLTIKENISGIDNIVPEEGSDIYNFVINTAQIISLPKGTILSFTFTSDVLLTIKLNNGTALPHPDVNVNNKYEYKLIFQLNTSSNSLTLIKIPTPTPSP